MAVAAVAPVAVQPEVKLFGRWSFDDIEINDISLADYIAVSVDKHATFVPHTAGRYSVKRFRKAQCPIVERLTNSLMMHGRNNGKKLMAVRIVKHAMEIIHLLTDQNPIQVPLVPAVRVRICRGQRFLYFKYFSRARLCESITSLWLWNCRQAQGFKEDRIDWTNV